MKKYILSILFAILTTIVVGQVPQAFKYQAVLRDANGEVIAEKLIGLKIEIIAVTNNTVVYTETHNYETSSLGLINLQIGEGESFDDFSTVNWGADSYKVQVSFDEEGTGSYLVMGESQLLSVPYALYSAQTAEKQELSINGNEITLTDGGSVTLPQDNIDDADADATNEIQALSISNDTIYLTSGGSVKLPAGTSFSGSYNDLTDLPANIDTDATDDFSGNYADLTNQPSWSDSLDSHIPDLTGYDTDVVNEIQDLQLTGDILTITNNASATEINLAPFVGTNTDEQTLSLTGTELTISTGNMVDLATIKDGYEANTDAQSLSLSGTDLSITGGNTLDVSTLQDGTGTDDQTISLSGNTLTLEDGGTVDLSAYLDDTDTHLTEAEVDGYVGNNGYLSTVEVIQGRDVSTNAPGNGQVLKWDDTSSKWLPSDDALGAAGTTDGVVTSAGITGTTTKTITLSRSESLSDVTVNFTDLVDDADASATNEIQDITLSGNNLSISSGSTVDLSTIQDGYEANTDAQTLSLSGTDLTISGGNVLDVSSLQDGTGTDDQTLSEILTGSTSAGTHKISDLVDPTLNQDAATKKYVDDIHIVGTENVVIAGNAGSSLTTGDYNILIGQESGSSVISTNGNVFVGRNTGQYMTGMYNVAIGYVTGQNATTGNHNTYLGTGSGFSGEGDQNVMLGYSAGYDNKASNNVMVGSYAGRSNNGEYNVFMGHSAGSTNNGSNNVFIGKQAGYFETGSDKLYITNVHGGDEATGRTEALLYGDFSTKTLDINATVKINNAFTLPNSDGTTGQVLSTDGSGNVSWGTVASGTDNQAISLSVNTLTLEDGGTVDLSAYLDDTDTQLTEAQVDGYVGNNGYLSSEVDGSITNEIQDLSLTTNTLKITNNSSASSIDLSGYLDNTDTQLTEAEVDGFVNNNGYLSSEVDGSITNEIQDLSLTTNTLKITNNSSASSIDLSAYLDDTDTQLTEAQVDTYVGNNGYLSSEVDGSVTNEIQDLSLTTNTLKITNNSSASSIDLSGYLDDTDTQLTEAQVDTYVGNNGYLSSEVDGSITNEIQDLSLTTNTLKITNNSSASSIDLSAYLDDTDTQLTEAEVDTYVSNNGYINSETDDQTVDVFSLSGTTLSLSLESDGQATKTVNLSGLQDGTGTDDQTLSEILTTSTSAGTHKISDVVDPTLNQDAATKKYVDDEISGVDDSPLMNTFLGNSAGAGNTTNEKNVMVGYLTGNWNSGSRNVFLGYYAGRQETGSDKLYISNFQSSSLSAGRAGALIYGDFSAKTLNFNATVGINDLYTLPTVDGTTNQIITTDGSGSLSWIDNKINVFSLTGSTVSISLTGDNEATKTLDLSGLYQTVDKFSLSGNTLSLSLLNDSELDKTVDLSIYENTSFSTTSNVTSNSDGDYTLDDFVFGSPSLSDDYTSTHDARMYFDKSKYAFRAGREQGDLWDDAKVGVGSFAVGSVVEASGDYSVAMGYGSTASNIYAIAMGAYAKANNINSVAIGYSVQSNATGAFTIGAYTTGSALVNSSQNSFKARFSGGYTLYTNDALGTGVILAASGSSWSTVSDSTKKENFKAIDGEDFLNKISKFKLTSWNYKGQDASKFRHYGPMAQDFYSAFGNDGVGTIGCDTLLTTADFMGVNFTAINALVKRTQELRNTQTLLESRVSEIEELKEKQAILEAKLSEMDLLKADIEILKQYFEASASKE